MTVHAFPGSFVDELKLLAHTQEQLNLARSMLTSPIFYADDELREACAVLQTYGDGHDYLIADAMIQALNRKEFIARNCPPQETPADVLATMRGRVPELLIGAAIGATVLLAMTGWL